MSRGDGHGEVETCGGVRPSLGRVCRVSPLSSMKDIFATNERMRHWIGSIAAKLNISSDLATHKLARNLPMTIISTQHLLLILFVQGVSCFSANVESEPCPDKSLVSDLRNLLVRCLARVWMPAPGFCVSVPRVVSRLSPPAAAAPIIFTAPRTFDSINSTLLHNPRSGK